MRYNTEMGNVASLEICGFAIFHLSSFFPFYSHRPTDYIASRKVTNAQQ
jgi:hypothetical protein